MSDNLALTEQLYALSGAGDWDGVRAMVTEDFFITEAPGLPFGGEYRGPDALRDLYGKVMGMMAVTGLDLTEMTVGGDWVIALVEMQAEDADGTFSIPLAEAIRFRDGKAAEIKPYYFDPALVHRAVAAKANA